MRDDDYVSLNDVTCVKHTAKAIAIIFNDDVDMEWLWIPHSQIHEDSEVYKFGTQGTLIISKWIAGKKGLA